MTELLLLIIACIAVFFLGSICYITTRILKSLDEVDFDLEEDEE